MDRFKLAFGSILLFAVATSLLAGWGLAGSLHPTAGTKATTTTALSTSTFTSTQQSAATSASSASTTTTISESTETASATTTVVSTTTTTTVTSTATAESTTTATSVSSVKTTVAGAAPGLAPSSSAEAALREARSLSLLLAPVAWIVLGGAWMWRGRVRAKYTELGFGSDVFELFMKMKGGATRIKVLGTLSTPKDRLQLAQELGVDWKTIDRHVQILNKYGFVKEQSSFGTVRLYEVTPMGKMLLDLFDDLGRTDGPVVQGAGESGGKDPKSQSS